MYCCTSPNDTKIIVRCLPLNNRPHQPSAFALRTQCGLCDEYQYSLGPLKQSVEKFGTLRKIFEFNKILLTVCCNFSDIKVAMTIHNYVQHAFFVLKWWHLLIQCIKKSSLTNFVA